MAPLKKGFFLLILTSSCWAQQIVTNEEDLAGTGLNLREAVELASSGETITFDALLSSKDIDIDQGEILIEKNVIIEGSSSEQPISISGNQNSRLFRIAKGAQLTLRNLNLSNGKVISTDGGAIFNEGNLTIDTCRISRCRARFGGGIFNSGTLVITNSTLDENSSTDDGAGIFNETPLDEDSILMVVRGSTFINNESESDSGAIHISRDSEGILENCTLTKNLAWDGGGAIENSQGKLSVNSCTIASNQALQRGGGIFTIGETTLKNSVLSDNRTALGTNDLHQLDFPSATFIPIGANIVEDPGNTEIFDNADPLDGPDLVLPGPARLFPAGYFGGPTMTMPPQLDSPALNSAIESTPIKDQRGFTRFADSNADLGAVEFIGVSNEILIDSDSDGVPNGVEMVTGTDPIVVDPEHPGHLRILLNEGLPTLSFGYVRSTSSRFILLIHRSTDLVSEEIIHSTLSSTIPNSTATPFRFIDDSATGNRAFYRLEVIRR